MTNTPDRPANPFAGKFSHQPYRMGGEKTPATTNPVDSVFTSLRITVERGKGYRAYRLYGAQKAYVFFPCDLNGAITPLVGDLRQEDDLKINWRVTWFIDARGHRVITKVTDNTTGEILAATDTQPALIETTVDEKTGQLTTEKQKLDPFGKPIDPVKVAMRNHVNAARGNENDYDYRADANNYDAERNKYMGIDTQPLVAAAITQGKDDPNPTPSPDEEIGQAELDKFFGKKGEKHFSENGDWWHRASKLFGKYKEAAKIKHRATAICEWFDLKDIKEWDVMPEAAFGLLEAELDVRFGAKAKVADPTPVKSVVPGYDPNKVIESPSKTGANDSVGSGQPATENKPIGDAKKPQETASEKPGVTKEEIRKKYNMPQRGKDYLVVQGRILLFRLDHPDWTIETEHIILTEDTAVFKAIIRNNEGRILGTGHGRATEAGTKNLGGRYIEKAETSAIGRALAISGYGTDDSLDDSDYLSDSPTPAKAA